MEGERGKFARIVIPSSLKEPLTYAVPPSLAGELQVGMRVVVPLGKRKAVGIIMSFEAQTPLPEVREILLALDAKPVLDSSLIELSHWISRYYVSPLGEVLETMLPPGLRTQSRRVIFLRQSHFSVSSELEAKIIEELERKRGKATVRSLAKKLRGGFYDALERLAALGIVEIRERIPGKRRTRTRAAEDGAEPPRPAAPLRLTPEQEAALAAMQKSLTEGGFEVFLLHGVTGSGKTEVYLRAMEEARKAGKRSLILVPEISLTPQLLDRLRERFRDRIGVLHSALAPGERWEQWRRILDGGVDVVAGARSALFAPVPDLGLIVVDEEHDPSYKQEEGLRYHARDLAVMRGKLARCPVLLGSATPSIESFENCRRGRYRLLELTQRVERKPLPRVEIVDLRARKNEKWTTENGESLAFFSPELIEALRENFSRRQQSLIFLNRRGFANFLQCYLCGFVFSCPHCSVTLTYHLKERALFCHHCGFREPGRDLCPKCGGSTLSGIGFGTERVEKELARALPEARIVRMDRDTTRKRGSQERLIRRWESGQIDVLVGTQMITKGHDVAGVTLVGAILADLSLNVPDFRAAERTFQLLSQVAGRAGRGSEPSRVIIQTYAPDHYALRHVIAHDYRGFFASEIEFRRALGYPPFSRLVHLRLEGPRPEEVEAKAGILGAWLRGERGETQGGVEILGPAPAPISKLRGRYRWQILLRGKKPKPLRELALEALKLPLPRHTRLFVDVDPYHML